MAGNQSAISICSNALILLGADPISDFSGKDAGSVAAANLFEVTYTEVLQSYDWNFSMVQRTLNRSPESPLFDYANKFPLPADCLRVARVSDSNYDILEHAIHSNSSSVSIAYIALTDINKAPIYFTNALEYLMAAKLSIPVTGDIDKASLYSQLAEKAMRKARHLDSRQTPTKDIQSKPFIEVRN